MSIKSILSSFLLIILCNIGTAQTDSSIVNKEYRSIEEALKNPDQVYRLDLSNQNIFVPNDVWSKFINLEYLSLKNDHLKELPSEIGTLKKLKVLDLSGNDFIVLPKSFSELYNLEELFLNEEKRFNLDENIEVLSLLPHLRILHLENDQLNKLSKKIYRLNHLESLYLNNNKFKEFPTELKEMPNLKYLDFHDNKLSPLELQNFQSQNFGIKIRF
jgi:Leucine-rich repeat (LRR) protein